MEASEDTDMTEAQQLLLTNLKKVWDEINSEAQREKAFCAIVETIKRMYEPARKTFNLCLLQKMSPTLKHRYCVLKEGLYKELQKAEYNSKPFFSTKDAVGVIDSSLIGSAEKYVSTYEQEHPAEKPNMIVLLDNFFEIIQQILVYRHAEPDCKEVATVTPLPTLAPAAAAPAA